MLALPSGAGTFATLPKRAAASSYERRLRLAEAAARYGCSRRVYLVGTSVGAFGGLRLLEHLASLRYTAALEQPKRATAQAQPLQLPPPPHTPLFAAAAKGHTAVLELLQAAKVQGAEHYYTLLSNSEVDYEALELMDASDMVEVGITALGARKKILHALAARHHLRRRCRSRRGGGHHGSATRP